MTMTALAAASRLEAMAEGKGGANVPYSTGGPLARDAAVLIPLDELHAEYARCQERYRTEEHTVSGVGPQRPRKKHYPLGFSPYRMTSHRVVQVERRAAKNDIKAIEDGMRGRDDTSTYFEEIGAQDRSPGLVAGSARKEMAKQRGRHLRSSAAKYGVQPGPKDFIGRRVRKAFPVADEKGRMVPRNFEGTVKKYSIPRQFFKVYYDDGDTEEYDMQELMDILIRREE